MEKANCSQATFNKWDQLIQDMDDIPDGIESDKMRGLLPHLRVTSTNVKWNGENKCLPNSTFEDPMEKYEKLIGDENAVDPVSALLAGRKTDSRILEPSMEGGSPTEDTYRNVLSPLKSSQDSNSYYDNDHAFETVSSSCENKPIRAIVPTFDLIEEEVPMVSTQENSAAEDTATSNWLSPVRRQHSWSGASLKRMAIDDSDSSIGKSKSALEHRKAKRGKYPWEIAKQSTDRCKSSFKTAGTQLMLDNQKKYGKPVANSYGGQKRFLGARRALGGKFVPPVRRNDEGGYDSGGSTSDRSENLRQDRSTESDSPYAGIMTDDRLKNIEPRMVELIMNEVMDNDPSVTWDDIAGLEVAKTTIQEIVVWPMLRPDIFTGLRGPPKGILLFGPPGTGKTLIGKCIASQSESTFFSISASSLTSKWIGEGEKMVRALFAVARCHQPAVIFMDEIDSLLSQRSETEHESSRRMKTEFLVQLDGATSINDERILIVGATNRPQELDEAARRRLVKRLYIPLPNEGARERIIRNLLRGHSNSLTDEEIKNICSKADGYSGADMANLCREAALGPIRSISLSQIRHIAVDEVRAISADDFQKALYCIRASVSDRDLQMYEDWNNKYGITPNQSLASPNLTHKS